MTKSVLYIVAQALQQPRIINRIHQKSKEYDKVIVYGFNRDFYNVDSSALFSQCQNVQYTSLGIIRNTQYLSRFFLFLKLIWLINRCNPLKKKQIYVFGLDLRIISCFFVNANIYYEISDIIWLYLHGWRRRFLMELDFILAGRSRRVVFTSKGFYLKYYFFLNKDKVIIIENKFETFGKASSLRFIPDDKLRVAYVGAFRYPRIISDLLKIFSRNAEMEINFYGDGFSDIIQDIKNASYNYPNINYFGAFRNPDDLQEIYSRNNINFVAYDNELENERVALPNKFYESGFFNIPIVCSEDTYVGDRVRELQMGWTIKPDEDSIEDFLKGLKISDILACHNHIKKLNKDLFVV